MCRTLPIFLYADNPIDRRLVEAWVADLGFQYLDVLPPLQGSWLGRFFATDHEPLTLDQFWNKHRHAHILTNIVGQLGILGATVSLAGIIASRYPPPPPPPVLTTTITQRTDPSPQPAQTTIINIYGLTNNIGPLVQAQTPEDARKIIEQMAARPDTQKHATKSRKADKAGKSSKNGKHGKGRKDGSPGNAGKKARSHKADRGILEA